MLHLAQVQKNNASDEVELKLLATKQSDDTWAVKDPEQALSCANKKDDPSILPYLQKGLLVLVDIDTSEQIASICEAKEWIVELVKQYLTTGITPDFLARESERVEQWRQDLTLQNQELARRTMEVEARKDQIQQLEEDLKQERKQLELLKGQTEGIELEAEEGSNTEE